MLHEDPLGALDSKPGAAHNFAPAPETLCPREQDKQGHPNCRTSYGYPPLADTCPREFIDFVQLLNPDSGVISADSLLLRRGALVSLLLRSP